MLQATTAQTEELAAESWSAGERIDGVVQVSPAAGVLAMEESLFLFFVSLLR
jgi:hypothetical protein